MLLKSLRFLAVSTFTLVFVLGCQETNSNKALRRVPEPGDEVVATVNGSAITASDVKAGMEDLARFKTDRYFSEDEKRELLTDLIAQEMIIQKAVRDGFALKNRSVRKVILGQYLEESIVDKFRSQESLLKETYNKMKEALDRILVSHIVVFTQDHGEEEAKKIITDIKKKIDSGELTFAEAVKKYSEDKSTKDTDGFLGLINRNTKIFNARFRETAFDLTHLHEISDPVKTPFGFHLIRLEKDLRGFDKNVSEVEAYIQREKTREEFDSMIVELNNHSQVDADYSKLETINLPALNIGETAQNDPQ